VHEIEGVVARVPGGPGRLRVSLGSSRLREGSLAVLQGNVVTAGPREITLQVGPGSEERMRIRFELE
jgi:hypothetical protein